MAKRYGRWQVTGSLGEGGQAHVFLVNDERGEYGGQWVLKRLKNKESKKRLERFRQEAEVLRKLQHPHILRLIDFDVEGAEPFIVTEYCAGGTLANVNVEGLAMGERLRFCKEVADGLSEAHRAGVVHRDVKPENVFLRSMIGPAVLGDFGLSYVESGERQTLLDEAVGSWLFMAPELEDGRLTEVRATADVYSMGKLIYWMLAGKRIFSREKHREAQYLITRLTLDERFEHFNALFDRTIVADPTRRLADATELWRELDRASRLFLDGYRSLTIFPARCFYCGEGQYRRVATHEADLLRRNVGIGWYGNGDPKWQIFACGNCGHMLWFRPDMSEHPTWLDKPFVDPYQ